MVVVAEMAVDLWKGRVDRSMDRRLATWCDRLVGNSHAVVDFYRGLGVPDDRLTMIYSGTSDEEPPSIDPRAIRADLGFDAEAPLVLFAGRLAEQKRVADLLKALDLLQHVQPDLRTVIAGDGPLRDQLLEMAHNYQLDGRVRFLGHRNDIPTLLAARRPRCLAQRYEGCPTLCLRRCGFANRSWQPVRRGRPRLSSTARLGCSSRSVMLTSWLGQSVTSFVTLRLPADLARQAALESRSGFVLMR